jgi:hypothetical protein
MPNLQSPAKHVACRSTCTPFCCAVLQFGQLTEVAISVLIMLYAPYQSFKAIKSISKTDDTKWLTFWVIYAGQ